MRLLISALTALMLFATPVVAGDWEDATAAYKAKDYEKAFRLYKPLAEQGRVNDQLFAGTMDQDVRATYQTSRIFELIRQGWEIVEQKSTLELDLALSPIRP